MAQQVLELALGFYSSIAYSIGFPECVFPDLVRLRNFMKKTKAKNVKSKLKALLEKLDENSHFISTERSSVTFSPKDWELVQQWRLKLEDGGKSPLARYCKVWRAAAKNRASMMSAVQDVEGEDYEPATKKSAAAAKKAKKGKGKAKRADSDSDSDLGEPDTYPEDEDQDEDRGSGRMISMEDEGSGEMPTDHDAAEFDLTAVAGDDVLEDFAMSDFELDSD